MKKHSISKVRVEPSGDGPSHIAKFQCCSVSCLLLAFFLFLFFPTSNSGVHETGSDLICRAPSPNSSLSSRDDATCFSLCIEFMHDPMDLKKKMGAMSSHSRSHSGSRSSLERGHVVMNKGK